MRIELSQSLPRPVVALGAEMKATVCCAAGASAEISEPVADLGNAAAFDQYARMVAEMSDAMSVKPAVLACDLHPDYHSTMLARRGDVWPGVPRIFVQHHEAHVASCAAAEGVWGDCAGLAFDGTGYGTDGTMWGGEFFVGSITRGFTRRGRLRPILLPGGSAAIREPWRLALALALEAGVDIPMPAGVDEQAWRVVHAMVANPARDALRSSSVGRLFDGVAALTGLCTHATIEAEAAIALERAAGAQVSTERYELPTDAGAGGLFELDWRPMIRTICTQVRAGIAAGTIAASFHDSIAAAAAEGCRRIVPASGTVAAAGGVFWNTRLTHTLQTRLREKGMTLVTPTRVPPSDAGLSLGQAVLAAMRA